MYLTRKERDAKDRDGRPNPGVRVRFPNGVTHFYPGCSSQVALVLAKTALPEGALDHPDVGMEYGTRHESKGQAFFVTAEVLKVPACEFVKPNPPGTHWTYAAPVNLPETEKGED